MTNFEGPNSPPAQPAEVESQSSPIPTTFPELETYDANDEPFDPSLTRGDVKNAEPLWQVEQRLGAINDAREDGTVTPEMADKLELDALREMRRVLFGAPKGAYNISLSTMHEWNEAAGQAPVNVPKYEKRFPGDISISF